jgi:acetylornithine deacetylase/succinyl-diaminopimelate desuccinylase-like protein
MKRAALRLAVLCSCIAYSLLGAAQTVTYSGVPYTTPLEAAYNNLLKSAVVPRMLGDMGTYAPLVFEEQQRIAAIAAPPFKEAERARYVLGRMRELGLADATIDAEGNVIGVRKGLLAGGPRLVVSAHLDTVFPEGTDVTVKARDGRFYAPGIADDARGLAVLLALLGAMQAQHLQTIGEVIFVGTVGEEELGNLRGVKALFRELKGIDGFISIDGIALDRIVNQGTGSHRYEVVFTGPGGHSFNAFGAPSAIHAMGRAIARIGDLQTPADPRTTFTVGTVRGGTSVNSIAGEARMAVDMRSNSNAELLRLEEKVMAAIRQGAEEENRRWNSSAIHVESRLIGDRPAGETPRDSIMAQAARRATQLMSTVEPHFAGASTDANLAMSLGVPALTVGGGGEGGGTHSLDEWYKPSEAWKGPQSVLLMVLALSGLAGVNDPLLEVRKPGL